MELWEVKDTSSSSYETMPTPSSFKLDWEDLDNNSYRSINSGDLIDTVISYKWLKCSFGYECISRSTRLTILNAISKRNPILTRIEDDAITLNISEKADLKMRCSKISSEMLNTTPDENGDKDYSLSFNLVQKLMITGQKDLTTGAIINKKVEVMEKW